MEFVKRSHDLWETASSKSWSEAVKPDFENLRGAFVWALEGRMDIVLGQEMAGRARRLWGRLAPLEGKKWLQAAESLIVDQTPRDIVALLWLADAHVHTALQQYKRALESAEFAQRNCSSEDDLDYLEASACAGCALAMLGRSAEAEPILERTLKAYKRIARPQLTAGAIVDLAFAKLMHDDAEAAQRLLKKH